MPQLPQELFLFSCSKGVPILFLSLGTLLFSPVPCQEFLLLLLLLYHHIRPIKGARSLLIGYHHTGHHL